jgi:hypothetical protein
LEILTGVGVQLGIVQVVDDLLDGRDGAVPMKDSSAPSFDFSCAFLLPQWRGLHLEVAADEELASHVGRLGIMPGWNWERGYRG